MHRVPRSIRVLLVLMLMVAATVTSLAADIKIRLRVPAGATPVIMTDTDGTGVYKLVHVGMNLLRFLNPDANVSLQVVMDPTLPSGSETTVLYGVTNGPDPMPALGVVLIPNSCPNAPPQGQTLFPGQQTSCTNCDVNIKFLSN